MLIFRKSFWIPVVFLAQMSLQPLWAQSGFDFSDSLVTDRLKKDVYWLASEDLEGREAGTPGEKKAAAYIKLRMQEAGLEPLFEDSFYQYFEFYGEWLLGDENFMVVGEEEFIIHKDFFVLPNAASARVYAQAAYVGFGMKTPLHNDYEHLPALEDKIFFMEYFLPEVLDTLPGPQPLEVLHQKIETAIEKGAAAIIFVNTQSERSNPDTHLGQELGREDIPVFFAHSHVLDHWRNLDADQYLFISAQLERETFEAVNVAGYLDNRSETTVVIGGHYDHLGYGGPGSRSQGVHAVHKGADDNASGVAGVLETARYLQQSQATANNYIFIAFSAEEKGLLGSRHFTQSDAYDMSRVNYMFNYDMIGRLQDNQLVLIGTGTSPEWESAITAHTPQGMEVRQVPSGMGGSDHTSFYVMNIPVLFFFTGIHEDYHRPGDSPDKINYEGMQAILGFSHALIETLDDQGRLGFSATPLTRRGSPRSEIPQLGLMPDHAYSGEGMKILAVTEDRPAQKAGLAGGDVITRIGSVRVTNIHTYMQALGNLSPGDIVRVVVQRGEEQLAVDVQL